MTELKTRGAAHVRLTTLIALLLLAISSHGSLAQDQAAASVEKVTFDIPAQPLNSALRAFAETTNLQLVYSADLVAGLTAGSLSGSYTPAEALQRLLSGSGLAFRFVRPGVVSLERAPTTGERMLGPVEVEGAQKTAGANGSTDATATEGTGSFNAGAATIASKFPQSLKETPQSVTVITQERIQQQNMTELTSVLTYTPGVTLVEPAPVGLPTPYSRGFLINTFQIDGGAPLMYQGSYYGNFDFTMAEFDHVELLRGSDAMYGGNGQPGGIFNLVHKRPLDHEQFVVDGRVGSWNNYDIEADATSPIGFDGRLRGRLVFDYHEQDFFFDVMHRKVVFLYGVVEADLPWDTLLRVGGSYRREEDPGFTQWGLPRYSDGRDIGLPRSTCICASWNRWNATSSEVFVSLEHRFDDDWQLKAMMTRLGRDNNVFYELNQGAVDPVTGLGQEVGPEGDQLHDTEYAADVTLNGGFQMFGLKQQLAVGVDYAQVDANDFWDYPTALKPLPVSIFAFTPGLLNPEPVQPPLAAQFPFNTKQWGGYATANFQPIEGLHLLGGGRLSSYRSFQAIEYTGIFAALGNSISSFKDYNVLTPYAGLTYDLTSALTLYASYADIYQSQSSNLDHAHKALSPAGGVTYEAGLKAEQGGGKLNASVALYYTEENNAAIVDPSTPAAGSIGNCCYFNNGSIISKGIDIEISGEVSPGWQIQGGYNYNFNRSNSTTLGFYTGNGTTFNTQTPRHQFKLWTSYTPPQPWDDVTLGLGFRLESARYQAGTVCSVAVDVSGSCPTNVFVPYNFTQPLYTVVDLRAAYRLNEHWEAALTVTNVADTSYYVRVGSSTWLNFYGDPRAVMFSVRAQY